MVDLSNSAKEILALALRDAIRVKDHVRVVAALDNGADPSFLGRIGESAVYSACHAGDLDIFQTLVKEGIDIDAPCVKNGESTLAVAAFFGSSRIVQFLLDLGADIFKVDDDRNAPLHRAASGGHVECIRLLLDAGADLESLGIGDSTPLILAASTRNPAAVETLLTARNEVTTG